MGASGAVARPPPAYTSPPLGYFPTLITPTPIPAQPAPARRPQSQLRLSFINSRSTTSTSSSFSAMYGMYAKPQPPKSQLKPLTCVVDPKPNPNPNPNLKQQPQKGKGERPRISKPITQPDGPLPGPHIIDIESIPQTQTQPQTSSKSKPTLRSGTTTSRRVQSGAIMHPPPVLPPPSQAHVYNRNSRSLPPGLPTPTPTPTPPSPSLAPAHARSPSFINPAPSNSRNNKYLSVDWKSTPPHPSNTSKIGLAF
ncbi:hypothetical protein CPC08DRAFT_710705 [Agrocybe pediades]|nr:hypothetical protein CPC08DRAFT_710705 [Agrocybe pediades]